MLSKISKTILYLILVCSCQSNSSITIIDNPAGENASLPRLFTDETGKVTMSWVEQKADTAHLYYSIYEHSNWIPPTQVSKSADWFVNWADYPSVISKKGIPIAAHWLAKIPGNTYSYNIEMKTYNEGIFSKVFVPHNDGTATEHGFVSMIPTSDSTFYSIWLDGRNTVGSHHGEHGNLSTVMTLRGALISNSGTILKREQLDNSVCECCNTAITELNGNLIAAYRNRTEGEIRDIYVKRMIDGVWEDAKPVYNDNWEINACPVNGPAMDAIERMVIVAWFTAPDGKASVKLSFSKNEGKDFETPIVLESGSILGRVDVIANNEHSAWVSWVSVFEDGAELNVKLISDDGTELTSYVVSEINPSRASGFPHISKSGESVLIAWTNIQNDIKSIKTAILQ